MKYKKVFISVILLIAIAIPFLTLSISAVDTHGRSDYNAVYVPCTVWLQNMDNVYIGLDYTLVNSQSTFGNADFYGSGNIPYAYGNAEFTTNYKLLNVENGVNINYRAITAYLTNNWSSFVVDSVGTYNYDIYNYSVGISGTYERNGNVFNRLASGDIKSIKLTTSGYAVNLIALSKTNSELLSYLNTYVRINADIGGNVLVTYKYRIHDTEGNYIGGGNSQTDYRIYQYTQVVGENGGYYYVGVLPINDIKNALMATMDTPIANDDYMAYIDYCEVTIERVDGANVPLTEYDTTQVRTTYVSNNFSSINETNRFNVKADNYSTGLKNEIRDLINSQEPINVDFTSWIGTAVSGFVDFNFGYGITIGGLLLVCLSFGVAMLFLKYFAGG